MSLTNARLGSWIVRELIGMGGTAEVYRADNVDGGPPVVIKVFHSARVADPEQFKNFRNEFQILERRLHPGIPVGRRFSNIAGRPCIVMDYLDGESMGKVLSQKAKQVLPLQPLRLLADLCDIVAAIHKAQLIHNDIKLENCILRPNGALALVDFGSVRENTKVNFLGKLFKRTETKVFGTPTYLAPEILAGGQPTYQSDLYALGVCSFRLLTGNYPFEAKTMTTRIRANVNQSPPSLVSRIPSIPAGPAAVLDKCLAKLPAERTASIELVQAAVAKLQHRTKSPGVESSSHQLEQLG